MPVKPFHYIIVLLLDALTLSGAVFIRGLLRLLSFLTPVCPFRAATGLKCPTCGGTGAMLSFLRGDLGEMLAANWFVVLLGAYLFFVLLAYNLWVFTKKKFAHKALKGALSIPAAIIICTVCLIYFLTSNFL